MVSRPYALMSKADIRKIQIKLIFMIEYVIFLENDRLFRVTNLWKPKSLYKTLILLIALNLPEQLLIYN